METDVKTKEELCIVQFQVTRFNKGFILVAPADEDYMESIGSDLFMEGFDPNKDIRPSTHAEAKKSCVYVPGGQGPFVIHGKQAWTFHKDAIHFEPVGFFGNASDFYCSGLECELESFGPQTVFKPSLSQLYNLVKEKLEKVVANTDTAMVHATTVWEYTRISDDRGEVDTNWRLLGLLDMKYLRVE